MEGSDEARKRYEEVNERIREIARAGREKLGLDETDPFAVTNEIIRELQCTDQKWAGSECLEKILKVNLELKKMQEADRKRKRKSSPFHGMTKAEK